MNGSLRGGDPREALGEGRVLCQTKEAYQIVVRVGDPSHAHVMAIVRTRYDLASVFSGGSMEPTGFIVSMLEVTRGGLWAWVPRLRDVLAKAKERARGYSGHVTVVVDLSRAPSAWHELTLMVQEPLILMVVTRAARPLTPASPWLSIGRANLLSQLNVTLHRPQALSFALPEGETGRWSETRVREALAGAAASPPVDEGDGYLTDATTQDDVTVTLGLAALWAEWQKPSPFWETSDPEELEAQAVERRRELARAWAEMGR